MLPSAFVLVVRKPAPSSLLLKLSGTPICSPEQIVVVAQKGGVATSAYEPSSAPVVPQFAVPLQATTRSNSSRTAPKFSSNENTWSLFAFDSVSDVGAAALSLELYVCDPYEPSDDAVTERFQSTNFPVIVLKSKKPDALPGVTPAAVPGLFTNETESA